MEPVEYGWRWVILTLFCFANLTNAAVWISCAAVNIYLQDIYDVDSLWVDMCSLVYMIVFVPMVFPTNYILDTKGLRVGITLGAVLTVIGAWTKVACIYSFWWLLIGNTIAGIGQPFILNSPSKISFFWFKPESRTLATTIAAGSNFLGVALGLFYPSLFITSSSSKGEVGFVMMTEAIFATVIGVLIIILFRNKPPSPPSAACDAERNNFKQDFKLVMKNKPFRLLLVAFSTGLGTLNCVASLIAQLTEPYGFNGVRYIQTESSLMGALTIFFGLLGSLVAGVIVDKKRIFKKMLVIILLGSMLSGIGFAFILFTESFVLVAIGASLFGFFIVAILPISYDFGCELTFPVGEAMTGGLLNLSGQIVGIITTLIVGTLTFEPLLANLFNAGVLGIGLISAIFIKEVLLRQRKDKNSLQGNPSTFDSELEEAR